MFFQFFGRDRRPETLSQRDRDRFIRARRAGKVGPSAKPVSDATLEHDLKFLIAVFNWAARSKDERGRPLLDTNPLKGLKMPTEKNPTRVVLAEEEYQALLGVSRPARNLGGQAKSDRQRWTTRAASRRWCSSRSSGVQFSGAISATALASA